MHYNLQYYLENGLKQAVECLLSPWLLSTRGEFIEPCRSKDGEFIEPYRTMSNYRSTV